MSCDSLSESVRLVADAGDVPELEAMLARLAAELGYSGAAYYRLTRFGEPVLPTLAFGAAFDAWIGVYIDRRYAAVDPVVPMAFRQDLPFSAAEAEALAPQPAKLHADRRKYWAADGLFCPVAASWGETGVLCWPCDYRVQLSGADRLAMGNLSRAFVTKFKSLVSEESMPGLPLRPLSRRESQCAFWLSEGKRPNEIATILALSIHTVRQYLNSAKLKLASKNTGEMLLRASSLGLITDRDGVVLKPAATPHS